MSLARQILQDSPIGYWPLNELSGTTAFDRSGSGFHGAITGGVTLGAAGPAGLKCMDFNGTTGWIDLTAYALLSRAVPWSIEAWANKDVLTGSRIIFSEGYESHIQYSLGSDVTGAGAVDKVNFGYYDSGGWKGPYPGSPDLAVGDWHQFVGTCTGTSFVLYMDGVSVATATTAAQSGVTFRGAGIGARPDTPSTIAFWDGRIAQVAFYSAVLSADRVLAHYQAGIRSGVVL